MQIKDARSLPSIAQEDLRYKAVAAVVKGMTQTEAAEVFNVSRYSVFKWTKAYASGGKVALRSRMRGRPAVSKLKGYEAASIVRIITDSCPEQMKLPFVLWTREAVQMLIARRCRLQLSIWTVGRYLSRWGFTPQKPARRACEKNTAEVKKWLEEEYPAIKKRAAELKAEIHWEDETGMRSDHQAGTTWAPCGHTPVVSCTGKRFRTNMISSITNRGKLAFRIYRCTFTAELFIDFLERLMKYKRQKVFVIVDGHPVHKSEAVQNWVKTNKSRIEMFFMPGYSPELNPDELLNQDVKTNAVGRQRAKTLNELESNIEQFLIQRQVFPEIVQKYFQKTNVVYAS